MAKKDEESAPAPTPALTPSPPSKKDCLWASAALVLSLVVLGIFVYVYKIQQKPILSDAQEKKALLIDAQKLNTVKSYKIGKLIINLQGRPNRLRFLELEMHLSPFFSQQIPLLEEHRAFLHDSIIQVAGRMKPKELNSLYGKILLEGRLKKRINHFFPRPILKEIFFTHFVVQ